MVFTQASALLDAIGSINRGFYPVLTTAVVALFIGVVAFKSVEYSNNINRKYPPRVWSSLPLIGSAVEFGMDCRAFLKSTLQSIKLPSLLPTLLERIFILWTPVTKISRPNGCFDRRLCSFGPWPTMPCCMGLEHHRMSCGASMVPTEREKPSTKSTIRTS